MKKINLLLFSVLFLSFLACETEKPQPVLDATIEFSKPYYLINEYVNLQVTTSSNVTGVRWDFGNGDTSTSLNPGSFEFRDPGIYDITLTLFGEGGIKKVVKEKVTIGQYHAYEAVLHHAYDWSDGSSKIIKLEVRGCWDEPEPFWVSPIYEQVKYEDLPLTIALDDIPLGGKGHGFYSYPHFKFSDADNGSVLGMMGGGTAWETKGNELFVSSLGMFSLKYKVVLPEEN